MTICPVCDVAAALNFSKAVWLLLMATCAAALFLAVCDDWFAAYAVEAVCKADSKSPVQPEVLEPDVLGVIKPSFIL